MSNDPTYSNIPLLITFLKTHKRAYLGDDVSGSSDLTETNGAAGASAEVGKEELVPAALQVKFRELFQAYFSTASRALVKGQTVRFPSPPLRPLRQTIRSPVCPPASGIQKLLEQDKKNYEAYIKAGEIFEDRQNAYERMTKAVEKLQAGVQRYVALSATHFRDSLVPLISGTSFVPPAWQTC